MNNKFLTNALLSSAVALAFLCSCSAGVNLNDMEKDAELNLNVALPIGQVTTKMSDFLGSIKTGDNLKIASEGDSANARIALFYHMEVNQPFTRFGSNFATKIKATNSGTLPLGVAATAAGQTKYNTGNEVKISIPVTFPDINTSKFFDSTGRIDSILVADANLNLTITLGGALATQSAKFRGLRIGSSDIQFSATGTPSFSTADGDLNFGQKMSKRIIHQFTINLMKDRNYLNTQTKPTLDQCEFNAKNDITIDLIFTVDNDVTVDATDVINYDFNFTANRYLAIWGWFITSNKLGDERQIDLNKEWKSTDDQIGWSDIKDLHLPLADPKIDMTIHTQVAGPLMLNLEELTVQEQGKSKHYATFYDDETGNNEQYLNWLVIPDDSLVNYKKETAKNGYDRAYTNTLHIGAKPSEGNLADLFKARPDYVNYKFDVKLNKNSKYYLQQRVTDKDNVDLDIDITMPMEFNKGLSLVAPEFKFDVDLSSIKVNGNNLNVDIDINDLSLMLDCESTIPFDIKVPFTFLDSLDQPIVINNFIDDNTDTLYIVAPTDIVNGYVQTPSSFMRKIAISPDEFKKFQDVRKLAISPIIESNDNSAFKNTTTVVLRNNSSLSVKLKASAALKAVLDLDKEDKEDKKQNTNN